MKVVRSVTVSLQNKVVQNMQIADYCLTANAFSPGVSRAYYSAYLHAKSYLLSNGVTVDNYRSKAAGWGVNFDGIRNPVPFGHETIWKVLKQYLIAVRRGTALKVSTAERLRDMRVVADYETSEHVEEELSWCLKFTRGFQKDLR
jgi:hypothetical protein